MDIFNKDDSQFISWNFEQKYAERMCESVSGNNDSNLLNSIDGTEDFSRVTYYLFLEDKY